MGKIAKRHSFAMENRRQFDLILIGFIAILLFTFLVPLNGPAIDFLLTLSLGLSLLTLFIVVFLEDVLSFSVFPSFLLLVTLFRLGLNIASTRIILTKGEAGSIIHTFGEIVTGGDVFVGTILFALITMVNLIVITKGSGRVAEVAARFHLDALPGKQAGIDADVQSRVIDHEEAKRRRQELAQESDFYGAMDGASKFVRGDAIAGVVIIAVNLLGGAFIGFVLRGMDVSQVVSTYLTLTVGDGLVTQIPALFVSVSSGIVVTHIATKRSLANALSSQLFNDPRVVALTATLLGLLALLPGMPLLIMMPVVVGFLLYAVWLNRKALKMKNSAEEKKGRKIAEVDRAYLIDPIELELGSGLGFLMTGERERELFEELSSLRRQLAFELGIIVPFIRIHDSSTLPNFGYAIKIKGYEVDERTLSLDEVSELKGNVAPRLITDHLSKIIFSHAADLLTRQEAIQWMENGKSQGSSANEELIPEKLSIGGLFTLLRNLLRERVSIRDRSAILESLANHLEKTTDIDLLTEKVRRDLRRALIQPYLSMDRSLNVISIDSFVEQFLQENIQTEDFGKTISIKPALAESLIEEIRKEMNGKEQPVVLLTTATLRPLFKQFIERHRLDIPVLSYLEVPPQIKIVTVGCITSDVLMEKVNDSKKI